MAEEKTYVFGEGAGNGILGLLGPMLSQRGVDPKVDNCVGYDVMYVYHMAKSDFFESSIISEQYLLQFVKDYLDDIDGYDGKALTRFYADCIGSGTPIMWEDMI